MKTTSIAEVETKILGLGAMSQCGQVPLLHPFPWSKTLSFNIMGVQPSGRPGWIAST